VVNKWYRQSTHSTGEWLDKLRQGYKDKGIIGMKLIGMAAENGNATLRIPNMAGGVSSTNSWCLMTLEGHQVPVVFILLVRPAAEVSFNPYFLISLIITR
jgi:hypothetical protein